MAIFRWGSAWTLPQASGEETHAYSLAGYWTAPNALSGALEQPFGIAVAASGDVYVTDARRRVVHLSRWGEVLGEWGREGNGPGEFNDPVGLGVGPDGTVYVSDYDQDRIQAFTPDGRFLRAFGTSGSAPRQLNAQAGVALDRRGVVFVADFYNHRIETFHADGSFERSIGHGGRLGAGALHYPTGLTALPGGELLVADAYNHQLQWFDSSGKSSRRAGYHLFWLWPQPARGRWGFHVPSSVAAGRNGLVHVADSGNHRIVMLSATGRYVTEWKLLESNSGIYSPEHIAVSRDGTTIYATDLASNRIIVLTVR